MSKYIKNWFSNMLPLDYPIKYQNIQYFTVENFYQAMKLPKNRTDLRLEISKMSPYEAKKNIRDKKKYTWCKLWTKEKSLEVMEYALTFKFKKGTTWYKKLMETGESDIIEWNNWNDIFWGKSIVTCEGENHLGEILMKIRKNLKENLD